MCLGEFGGHKVLDRSQENDDSCSDQGTDTEDVVEKDHTHNDLEKVMGGELCARAPCQQALAPSPPSASSVACLSAPVFKHLGDGVRTRYGKAIYWVHTQLGSELVTRGIYPKVS